MNGPVSRWMLLLAVVLFQAGIECSRAAELYVGVAETNITPERPVALEGQFRLRISQGVDSPITASVVVIESRNGDDVAERAIMVSADLVHLPNDLLQMVRTAAAEKLPGLDTGDIFISVTHTHAAPVVMPNNFIVPDGVMTIDRYCELFATRVAKAIEQAQRSMRPASVAWGLGHAQVAYNRRTAFLGGNAQMYGPTDRADYKGPEGPEFNGIPALFFFDDFLPDLPVGGNHSGVDGLERVLPGGFENRLNSSNTLKSHRFDFRHIDRLAE